MATDSTLLKSIAKALWRTQDWFKRRRMVTEILISTSCASLKAARFFPGINLLLMLRDWTLKMMISGRVGRRDVNVYLRRVVLSKDSRVKRPRDRSCSA
ncbi:hypothetical protein TcasGA2_TC008249 [Tribolium castaneum]|uniref:Uncharacterized protein n=1 Tax=Tribolium castaneum TaxID=7070 RepID=D2A0P7_TRICA|nr:hypothetical protein TcasGA2_TC008249 [Tribolium castaneum]